MVKLLTSDHEVPLGLNLAGGRIPLINVCMVLHCTEHFIITLPLSRYDLNNVKLGVKYQIIIIILFSKSSEFVRENINAKYEV